MIDDLHLIDGFRLPALGFGLYKVPLEQTEEVVVAGVAAGYRLVDGAEFYANESQVGRALHRVDVDRSLLTITSKFWGEESRTARPCLRPSTPPRRRSAPWLTST